MRLQSGRTTQRGKHPLLCPEASSWCSSFYMAQGGHKDKFKAQISFLMTWGQNDLTHLHIPAQKS